MTSLQLKYLLAAGVGVAVIGVGAWAYVSKPKNQGLDLNKSVADSKPPRSFELSSDKSTTVKPNVSGSNANTPTGTAKPTTPPSATPVTPPKTEVSPPARRTMTEPAIPPTPTRSSDSAAPPGSITPPPEATRNTFDSPTTITPPTAGADVKLPPIGGSASPSTTTGGGTETPVKPVDTLRTPGDKPQIPEARPASESDKSAIGDGPRVTFPPPSPSSGEQLKPTGGPATPPDRSTPAGRRNIRDTEIERPGGGSVQPKPSPSRETTTPPSSGAAETYTIASGDTLGKIAAARYGDEKLWTEIKKANPGLDENRLKVGTKLTLPARTGAGAAKPDKTAGAKPSTDSKDAPAGTTPARPEKPAVAASGESHTVASGETLVKIARTHLKDDKRWREIYELNRDKLKNPNAVEAGMVLKLPTVAKSDAAKRESTSRGSGSR